MNDTIILALLVVAFVLSWVHVEFRASKDILGWACVIGFGALVLARVL